MADSRFRRAGGGVSSLGLQVGWRLLGGGVTVGFNELLDKIVAREVISDQVEIFVRVPTTCPPTEVARQFKGRTSRVLRGEFRWLGRRDVLWSKP